MDWSDFNEAKVERRERLEPDRKAFAIHELQALGYEISDLGNEIQFMHFGRVVKVFPYTGWYTGKRIGSGRGIAKLLKRLSEVQC